MTHMAKKLDPLLKTILITAAFLSAFLIPGFSGASKDSFSGLTILYSADERGEIEPCG